MGNHMSLILLDVFSILMRIFDFLKKGKNKELNKENISIPKELLHIILDYDGKINYRNGKYINALDVTDGRYDIIRPILIKKMEIMKIIELDTVNKGFYFELSFNMSKNVGLVYDYNFSYDKKFEICYYDWRDDNNIIQLRTNI